MELTGVSKRAVGARMLRAIALLVAIVAFFAGGCATAGDRVSSPAIAGTVENGRAGVEDDEFAFLEDNDEFALLEEELDEQAVEVSDPLEPLNRVMYGVNDALFTWVLEPAAGTWEAVIPEDVRVGIDNFFDNLTTPARYVNCLLQGKGESADIELRRFFINTTEGILGFGDPASEKHSLEQVDEDLGQTLGAWGVDPGFYIVLPLFGPSTARDAAGMVGDWFLNPVRYIDSDDAVIAISAGKVINERSFHVGEYESFKLSAIDPYVAMRDVYLQYRKKQVQE